MERYSGTNIKNMKILITGINGFAASWLAKKLVAGTTDEIHGTIRIRSDLYRIKDIKDKLHLHTIELADAVSVQNVLQEVKPDQIYHLAAQSYVKSSWDAPIETYLTTTIGTVNLLEAARRLEKMPEILIVSTSEIYGHNDGLMNEDTNPVPATHYGIAKYTQDLMGRMYWDAYKVPIVITRAFNITGWGRGDAFADSSFAKQIVEIEKGIREPIVKHGNLETERVFVDVNDAMNGYISALDSKKWGDIFCFGNDEPVKMQKVLDTLIGLSTVKVTDEIDPSRLRPVDVKTMRCDATKAKTELGWKQEVPFEKSMENLLIYWRERI
jgi:GDP-4-dehydro-6-deoxy-D-mannose reductase